MHHNAFLVNTARDIVLMMWEWCCKGLLPSLLLSYSSFPLLTSRSPTRRSPRSSIMSSDVQLRERTDPESNSSDWDQVGITMRLMRVIYKTFPQIYYITEPMHAYANKRTNARARAINTRLTKQPDQVFFFFFNAPLKLKSIASSGKTRIIVDWDVELDALWRLQEISRAFPFITHSSM